MLRFSEHTMTNSKNKLHIVHYVHYVQIRLCWPLCAFRNYIYLLIYLKLLLAIIYDGADALYSAPLQNFWIRHWLSPLVTSSNSHTHRRRFTDSGSMQLANMPKLFIFITQRCNGALQASPPAVATPAPFTRWIRIVSSPAVVYHTTQPIRHSRGYPAYDDRMTSLGATVSACLRMAHYVQIMTSSMKPEVPIMYRKFSPPSEKDRATAMHKNWWKSPLYQTCNSRDVLAE